MAATLTLLTVDYTGKTDAIPVTPVSAVQPGAVIPFSALDLVNPKRGQYQDLGVTLYPESTAGSHPAWPGTDDAGNRFLWSQIQPTSANSYDFTIIDKAIAAAHVHNQRFHFRVMSFASTGYSGNTVIGVPAWLRATPTATTDYHVGGKTYVVPNWNADAYLSPLEHLIAALGARYDHDERVEWFEFSGYGDWSEDHIGSIAEELGAPGPSPDDSIAQLGYYSQYGDQSINKAIAYLRSMTEKSGHRMLQRPHAAARKPTSNGALCAVSTQLRANARKPGRTAPTGGAWLTIASVMPVSVTMSSGIGRPGLTSVENSAAGWPSLTRTAAISVMAASCGCQPVVSTSTTTKSARASHWIGVVLTGPVLIGGGGGGGGAGGSAAGGTASGGAGAVGSQVVTRSP